MPKFKCVNNNCSLKGEEISIGKVRFIFDKKSNKLKPSPKVVCLNCGNELESISTGNTEGFCFNKFDSLTTQEKRQIIRKRSQAHFNKTDKGDLANYKQKIIDDNKRMVEGR